MSQFRAAVDVRLKVETRVQAIKAGSGHFAGRCVGSDTSCKGAHFAGPDPSPAEAQPPEPCLNSLL